MRITISSCPGKKHIRIEQCDQKMGFTVCQSERIQEVSDGRDDKTAGFYL